MTLYYKMLAIIFAATSRVDGFCSDANLFQRQGRRIFLGSTTRTTTTDPRFHFGNIVIPRRVTANDDELLGSSSTTMSKEDIEYARQIFAFAKQRASPELQQEYEDKLEDGQTWYDRPDLQEEFLLKVEREQLEKMVKLQQDIQETFPDIYASYVFKAQEEAQSSLLTVSPTSSLSDDDKLFSFSIAHERPDLMIRMEQEYTIWKLMEQQIKEYAPELYREVYDELVSEQQEEQDNSSTAPPPTTTLSSILMDRNDLLQKVNSKVNQLTANIEDITQAVMKKPNKKKSKRKQQGGAKDKKKKSLGFGK